MQIDARGPERSKEAISVIYSGEDFERYAFGDALVDLDIFRMGRVQDALLAVAMGVQTAVQPADVVLPGPPTTRGPDGKSLVAECLAGGAQARARFQEEFGPLIYRFASYAAGSGRETESGDFYVYLFENDRLYRRLRSYEGRTSLGAFLRGFVLPDMFKQFHVMTNREKLETVSLDTDCVREPAAPADTHSGDQAASQSEPPDLFQQLSPDKCLLVKLLYIEDFDLAPADVQMLAERSGRPVREVVERVERARALVRDRESKKQRRLNEAESAAQWILQYERRLAQVATSIENLPPRSTHAERLRDQQAELERKRQWRMQQRTRALNETERATVTLAYREIADLLNQPIGTVSAQVTRLRQELLATAAQRASGRSSPPRPPGAVNE